MIKKGEKKMDNKKDMIKYRNEFNLTDLNSLDKVEQDILFTVCSRFTAEKGLEVIMTFDELRKRSYLSEKRYSYEENIKKLNSLADKITSVKFRVTNEENITSMVLFPRFTADLKTEKIHVKLNSDFSTYLYDIPEKIGFSLYELKQFVYLKSKYSKTLFRFLVQNFQGKWTIGIDDLRNIMGFPKSYAPGKIIKYVQEILPELESTGYFSDIEMDYTTYHKQGRPIKDIIFSYKLNEEKALERQGQMRLDYEPVIEQKEKMTTQVVDTPGELPHIETTKTTIQEEKKCPKCGAKVIQRRVSDERKDSFGKLYEKCEKNDKDNQQCKYFKWLE